MFKIVLFILVLPFIVGAQTSKARKLPKFITEAANSYAQNQIRNLGIAKTPCYKYVNKQKNFNWICVGKEEDWLLRAETVFIHLDFKRSTDKNHFCLIDKRDKNNKHLDCYTVCINQISHKRPDRCYQEHDDVQDAVLDVLNFKRTKNFKQIMTLRFGEGYSVR